MPKLRLACLLAVIAACGDDEVSLQDASVDAATMAPPLASSLDVLFVVDNSATMGPHQQRLAAAIPRFIERLSQQAQSLHVGVVTTNLGGLQDLPANASAPVRSCAGVGDDGRLQASIEAARDGTEVECRDAFCSMPTTVLVAPDPACALDDQPAYQAYTQAAKDTRALGCVARVGVLGCPFEQPLEAMRMALGAQNPGFLRADAALAVVVLSDEDDCSVTVAGRGLYTLSDQAEAELGPVNLRCGRAMTDASLVHPLERYADALRALKPGHPERFVYTAIAGVPAVAVEQRLDPSAILALPEMRFREDPQNLTFPKPVCEGALPGIRLVQLADVLATQAVVGSLCGDDVGAALERTADKLLPLLQ
jgi:hypothetical protein